jgi:hypothetical protein
VCCPARRRERAPPRAGWRIESVETEIERCAGDGRGFRPSRRLPGWTAWENSLGIGLFLLNDFFELRISAFEIYATLQHTARNAADIMALVFRSTCAGAVLLLSNVSTMPDDCRC